MRLDKAKIKKSFSRQAACYDQFASFQREIAQDLLTYLPLEDTFCGRILDLGTGTGYVAQRLAHFFPQAALYGCDIAHGMSKAAQRRLKGYFRPVYMVTADAEELACKTCSLELVVSNLTCQWLGDLGKGFRECYRALRPGGRLQFSILGEESLKELRESLYQAIPSARGYAHLFPPSSSVEQCLLEAGFGQLQLEMKFYYRYYNGVRELLLALKRLGAGCASALRPRGLASRSALLQLSRYYEKTYRRNGRIIATYQVIFAQATK